MACEQYAFIDKAKIPSRDEWQAAIDACGFDFQLDPTLIPFEDSGFLPCKLSNLETGFEIYYDSSPEFLEDFADIAQGRDYCIAFRWSTSLIECCSAMIASYALAKNFDAIVSYEREGPYESLEDFLEDIKNCFEEIINEN